MARLEEAGISIYRESEVRGTYIGGFPEPGYSGDSRSPEGVARKAPLCGKFCCAEDRLHERPVRVNMPG